MGGAAMRLAATRPAPLRWVIRTDAASRRRDQQIVDLIGPGDRSWPAWVGFGALLLGVAVGTAASIVSAA